jgi:hypothetical protein
VTRIAWARDKYLRTFQRDFIESFQRQAAALVGSRG